MGAKSVKAKLWLEGLRGFHDYAKEWLVWAIPVFVILSALLFTAFTRLQGPWLSLPHDLPNDPQELAKVMAPVLKPGAIWFGIIELVMLAQYYFFVIFFARRGLKAG